MSTYAWKNLARIALPLAAVTGLMVTLAVTLPHASGSSRAGLSVADTLTRPQVIHTAALGASQEVRVLRGMVGHPRPVRHHRGRSPIAATTAQVSPAQAAPVTGTTQDAPVVASGNPQEIAQAMLGAYGWGGDQFGCLVSLWNVESGWNPAAYNQGSGAYGIPQALPGDKMSSAGSDWQTNPATQIRWGLGYIKADYGSPCGAWGHEEAAGWY